MTKNKTNVTVRPAVALLAALFIIMAVTILALAFLSTSDMELAVGQGMALRAQMDALADSGLQHAKGLILNPQEIGTDYWTGANGQQLAAGDDYYDVSVVKLGQCDYQITSTAYRLQNGQEIGRSILQADLRLHPCIAYWQTQKQDLPAQVTITGDAYCADDFPLSGRVNGDVFAAKNITGLGLVQGQKYPSVTTAPISLPGISHTDYSSQYYYDGAGPYSVNILASSLYNNANPFPSPGANNPGGVCYKAGDLDLGDTIVIKGTLVVEHDLRLKANADVTIIPVKNFPALVVGHDLRFEVDNARLSVTGYAQIAHRVDFSGKAGTSMDVSGALYVLGDGIQNTTGGTVTVTAVPNKAALWIWPTSSTARSWSPAADAFFKSIQRQ